MIHSMSPTLDGAQLESRCPLDNGRHSIAKDADLKLPPTHLLNTLPLELITPILLALDLPTLTNLRRVNSSTMALIDSIHQYAAVAKLCRNVLRAIVSIKATSFDLQTLYHTLSAKKCAECDEFGVYLYLITCERLCAECCTSGLQGYVPVTTAQAAKHFGITEPELDGLPQVISLPLRYSGDPTSQKRPALVDRRSILEKKQLDNPMGSLERAYQVMELTPDWEEVTGYLISAPVFDSYGQSAEWGIICPGCDYESITHDQKYLKTDFPNHIKQRGKLRLVEGRLQHALAS